MTLITLFIGAILVVSALRNTYGSLFTALGIDIPAFVVWAAAILALGAIGFIPGLKPISRGLMALVLIVIVLRNYQNIIKGFQAVSTAPSTSAQQQGSSTAGGTPAPASSSTGGTTIPAGGGLTNDATGATVTGVPAGIQNYVSGVQDSAFSSSTAVGQ